MTRITDNVKVAEIGEKRYKLVVYVPESHSERLREAIGNAGAGIIGNYTHCMFILRGTSQFKPGAGSHPAVGTTKELEMVEEDRIETVCSATRLPYVIAAIRDIHPYEEPATDIYPIEIV